MCKFCYEWTCQGSITIFMVLNFRVFNLYNNFSLFFSSCIIYLYGTFFSWNVILHTIHQIYSEAVTEETYPLLSLKDRSQSTQTNIRIPVGVDVSYHGTAFPYGIFWHLCSFLPKLPKQQALIETILLQMNWTLTFSDVTLQSIRSIRVCTYHKT